MKSDKPPKSPDDLSKDFKTIVGALNSLHASNERAIEKLDSKVLDITRQLGELTGAIRAIQKDVERLQDTLGVHGKDIAVLETTGSIRIQRPDAKKDEKPKEEPEEDIVTKARAKAIIWSPILTSVFALILSILNQCQGVQVQNTPNGTTVTMPSTTNSSTMR